MHTSSVHRIVSEVGSEAIEEILGVTKYSIRAAKRDRLFPARWYEPLRILCVEQGVDCPVDAFRWIDTNREGAA